jgi:hypothetical protein
MKKDFEVLDNFRLQRLVSVKTAADKEELADLEQKVNKLKADIEAFGPVDYDNAKINKWILDITHYTVESAKIENIEDQLRQQLILAFKADTTTERWDSVSKKKSSILFTPSCNLILFYNRFVPCARKKSGTRSRPTWSCLC